MSEHHISFYQPEGTHYIAQSYLWVIARIRTEDGFPWLEIECSGNDYQIAIYCSHLDAQIQCLKLNTGDKTGWQVYPFADLNRYELARHLKIELGQVAYSIALIFGFSASSNNKLTTRQNGSFDVMQYNYHWLLDELINAPLEAALPFPDELFELSEHIWQSAIGEYISRLGHINQQSTQVIKNLALTAFREVNFNIGSVPLRGPTAYVSAYFPELGWQTASFENECYGNGERIQILTPKKEYC